MYFLYLKVYSISNLPTVLSDQKKEELMTTKVGDGDECVAPAPVASAAPTSASTVAEDADAVNTPVADTPESFTMSPLSLLHRRSKSNPTPSTMTTTNGPKLAMLPNRFLIVTDDDNDDDASIRPLQPNVMSLSAADSSSGLPSPSSDEGEKTVSNSSNSAGGSPMTTATTGSRSTPLSPPAMQPMQRFHNLRVQTDFSAPSPSPAASSPRSRPKSPLHSNGSRGGSGAVEASDDSMLLLLQRDQKPSATAVGTGGQPQPHAFRLADFFYKEIFGVHDIKQTDEMHQERVQNFLVVPYNIEQMFVFGVFLALDSFLYVFTYLPLRILFACGCAVTSSFHTRVFRRTHFYDLMVAVIIFVATLVLWRVDMSRVYHAIRGQAMIKLYVLFTMIEVLQFYWLVACSWLVSK